MNNPYREFVENIILYDWQESFFEYYRILENTNLAYELDGIPKNFLVQFPDAPPIAYDILRLRADSKKYNDKSSIILGQLVGLASKLDQMMYVNLEINVKKFFEQNRNESFGKMYDLFKQEFKIKNFNISGFKKLKVNWYESMLYRKDRN